MCMRACARVCVSVCVRWDRRKDRSQRPDVSLSFQGPRGRDLPELQTPVSSGASRAGALPYCSMVPSSDQPSGGKCHRVSAGRPPGPLHE